MRKIENTEKRTSRNEDKKRAMKGVKDKIVTNVLIMAVCNT